MSTTQTEKQFVSTYLQLINLSNNTKLEDFNSTSDYYKIESLGPTLPKINVALPKASSTDKQERTISVKIKSIKPPYKFSTEINNISCSTTIFSLKSELIKNVPVLQEAGITPGSIKLLVKGKVSSDTLSLDSVSSDNEISFMAMVAASASTPASTSESVVTQDHVETKSIASITENTWSKIHSLIKEDLNNQEVADEYILKFKKSIN